MVHHMMYITRQHRTPAYVCICICMLHMVHHIMYIARQHKDTSIQLVAPVHVTYACMYTQGHPLRSQGPAQKRKDTRIELVVLVHGGRRDVIRPAPHVDLSHTAGALACQISCRACTCGVRVSSRACIQRHGSRPSPRSRSCLNACMRVCLYASAKDLVSAVLLYGLLLVQALERAVMPLVEAPIFLNRDPQESHVLQDRQACLDRPLQD